MSSYVVSLALKFGCTPERVYELLTDLSTHRRWNKGLIAVSSSERMTTGLHYQTESALVGDAVQRAEIEVVKLVPNKYVELNNEAGLIAYRVTYDLSPLANGTMLTCTVQFDVRNFVLNLARPAIESMARSRLQGDLETLRDELCPVS